MKNKQIPKSCRIGKKTSFPIFVVKTLLMGLGVLLFKKFSYYMFETSVDKKLGFDLNVSWCFIKFLNALENWKIAPIQDQSFPNQSLWKYGFYEL